MTINSGSKGYIDILDALDWSLDDALDHLNNIDAPAGCSRAVEDQSLAGVR